MAELSKPEILIEELNEIQKQVSVILNKLKDVSQRNKELEGFLSDSKAKKEELAGRVQALETELGKLNDDYAIIVKNSLNLEEKESIKLKIRDLITRLDDHLSS